MSRSCRPIRVAVLVDGKLVERGLKAVILIIRFGITLVLRAGTLIIGVILALFFLCGSFIVSEALFRAAGLLSSLRRCDLALGRIGHELDRVIEAAFFTLAQLWTVAELAMPQVHTREELFGFLEGARSTVLLICEDALSPCQCHVICEHPKALVLVKSFLV
jgi:hypothetical protein